MEVSVVAENGGGSEIKEIRAGGVVTDAPITDTSEDKRKEKGGTKTAWRKLATGSGSMPAVPQGRKQQEGPVMGAESWPALADARPKSNNGNSGGKFMTDATVDRKSRDAGPKNNPPSSSSVPAQSYMSVEEVLAHLLKMHNCVVCVEGKSLIMPIIRCFKKLESIL